MHHAHWGMHSSGREAALDFHQCPPHWLCMPLCAHCVAAVAASPSACMHGCTAALCTGCACHGPDTAWLRLVAWCVAPMQPYLKCIYNVSWAPDARVADAMELKGKCVTRCGKASRLLVTVTRAVIAWHCILHGTLHEAGTRAVPHA